MQITVTADPDADDIARVDENLSRFNDDDVGPAERKPLSVFVRDGDGVVIAGINAFTAWGWLYVQRLCVARRHLWRKNETPLTRKSLRKLTLWRLVATSFFIGLGRSFSSMHLAVPTIKFFPSFEVSLPSSGY